MLPISYFFLFIIILNLLNINNLICAWLYFPNNKGFVSGLIVAGFGFGSFLFNFVCLNTVNPTN